MKKELTPLLFLFLLLFRSPAQAQSPAAGIQKAHPPAHTPLAGCRAVTIRLPEIKDSGIRRIARSGFFSHFDVLDERPDTARIGIHSDAYRNGNFHNRQLIFGRTAAEEVANYLNARFAHPGAPCTALVVLRLLWLTDPNYSREDMLRDPQRRLDRSKIMIRAEIYAVKDSVYVPLYRYDSLFISTAVSYRHYGMRLASLLDDLADSSTVQAAKKWVGGRRLTLEDIRHFNQARFDAAIFRAPSLAPGVYRSFSEFRNNNPSITSFEIKKDKNTMFLYLKEAGGQSYYSHNAWGYCDGQNVFVMKDGMLNPAWNEGKAWYLMGLARIEDASSPASPAVPLGTGIGPAAMIAGIGASAFINNMAYNIANFDQAHVFAIDLETGAFY